jgi:hypothetical protein
MNKIIVVSIDNILDTCEHYRGELFDFEDYDVLDVPGDQLATVQDQVLSYEKSMVIVRATNGRHSQDLNLSMFDAVVVFDSEAIDTNSDTYLQTMRSDFNNCNIRVVCNGYHKKYNHNKNLIYLYPFWLCNISRCNTYQPTNSINSYHRMFDALLGGWKNSRQIVFNKLQENNLLDLCFINYTTRPESAFSEVETIYRTPELDLLEEQCLLPLINNSSGFNSLKNIGIQNFPRASNVVPWKIYERSLYSIVTETVEENYDFFSEKTAKCLYAQRLFVFFGGQGQLADLQNMGFQTFGSVIDESFDHIEDLYQRFSSAMDQVIWLSKQDHNLVYKKIQPVLIHNQNHLCNRHHFIQPLKQWLDNCC